METKKKKKKRAHQQLSVAVLDELAARFLRPAQRGLNLMKNVEIAQWFYLDHMRPVDKDLPYLNPLAFNTALYRHHTGCEANQAAEMHRSYVKHLAKVPCAGTAVFDPKYRKLLMVQGDFKGCPWGFPKGKIDDGETLMACAARETMEETGLDVAHLLSEKHKIQLRLGTPKKDVTLYIAVLPKRLRGKKLQPAVRNEIGKVGWVDLPLLKPDVTRRTKVSQGMASPFWEPLVQWLANNNKLPAAPICSPCSPDIFFTPRSSSASSGDLLLSPQFVTPRSSVEMILESNSLRSTLQPCRVVESRSPCTRMHWCLKDQCLFSQQGFESKAKLKQHNAIAHKPKQKVLTSCA